MNKKLNNNFSLRKLLLTALVAGPLATLPAPLWALPSIATSNLTPSSGVTVQQVGTTTLNVASPDKGVLTWIDFGFDATGLGRTDSRFLSGETINFTLPTSTSSVLNTVSGGSASTLGGKILSNGNVYILNPAGIVISDTAQINTGGFYASTVSEPSGYFSINGSLSFAGTSTANIVVNNSGAAGPTITAVGTGNNIYLVGKEVDVRAGAFYGNLFVRSSSAGTPANSLAGGASVAFGAGGPVTVNQTGVPLVGGGLNVTTNGGAVLLSGAGSLSISPGSTTSTGAVVVNTTGQITNGNISQGAGSFVASTPGTVVTLNAGTSTSSGNITLSNVDFLTVAATGNNVTINDFAGDVTLGASAVSGNLVLSTNANRTDGAFVNGSQTGNILASGATSVGGTITLAIPNKTTIGSGTTYNLPSSIAFTGSGNITFASITAAQGLTITSSGDITLPTIAQQQALAGVAGQITGTTGGAGNTVSTINGVVAERAMSIVSTGGKITAPALYTASTLTLTASSSAGSITAGVITSATGTISTVGDLAVSTTLRNTGGSTLNVTSTTGNITLGAVSASSTLNLTATAGSISTGNVQSNTTNMTAANGTIKTDNMITGNTLVMSSGAITTGTITSSSAYTLTASTGSISTGNVSTTSGFVLTATQGSISTGTITSTSTVTLTAPSAAGSVTTGLITSTIPAAGAQLVTLSSGGSVSLAGGSIPLLNVVSTTGTISQTGAIVSSSKATFNAAGDINLSTAANDFTTVVLVGGASSAAGFTVVDANNIVIGGGTNARPAVSITAGQAGGAAAISLGGSAFETLTFGSNLNLNQANAVNTGVIDTKANVLTVFGNVNVTTQANNAATIGSDAFSTNAANYSFGQINANVGSGALKVFETQTLNLGTITAGSLDARSLASDIVNTGQLKISTTSVFAANSFFNPGNVTLNNTSNQFTGAISIGNAKDVSIVNTLATTVFAGSTQVNGKAVTGALTVTVTGSGNGLTLAPGAGTGGDFTTVGFNVANGAVNITDTNGLTLQNAINSGTGTVTINSAGALTLGSGIALGSSGLTTLNSTGANAAITDSAPNIRISGNVKMSSDNSISITNTGHSLGAVGLVTTGVNGVNGTADIKYTEGGTANLGVVTVGAGANIGSLTIVSTGGNIMQAPVSADFPAGGSITVPTVTGGTNTVSFTSNSGAVILDRAGNTNMIAPAVNISAVGNSSISQPTAQNLILGNVAVSAGTFAASANNVATATITQLAGSTAKVYGNSSFSTQGGKITLTNTGNNFGGVTLDSTNAGALAAGADVAITEAGTLNFVSVKTGTTGKLAATSEKAGIIQSGTAGLVVGGATTLTAAAAGITLNTGTTSNTFGGNNGILITTVGNVSIQDASAITALAGGSNIGGTLTLKNTNGAGEIKDTPGSTIVSGNVLLDTGTVYNAGTDVGARINLGSSNLSFGSIQFRSGKVTIVENATTNLAAGSVASGPVSITSSGNILTSGSGGGTFQNTLALNASGSITITNPIFVNGANNSGLTFRALGAVDLSALSLAGNLNSIAPTNLGASSYKAPSP